MSDSCAKITKRSPNANDYLQKNTKQPQKRLKNAERLQIIDKIRNKEASFSVLAQKYEVTRQAINFIWQNRHKYESALKEPTYNGTI